MSRFHGWPEDPTILRVARRTNRCTVLGPGVRAVLWMQGCPFRCPGCVARETLPFAGGMSERVEDLAAGLSRLDIEGITFSGGEPFAQPAALCALIDLLHDVRPNLSFMSYTGYQFEHLQARGTDVQKKLLAGLDILVDGRYVLEKHTDLRWRGSSNQRLLFLSSVYRGLTKTIYERGRWIEVEYGNDGSLHWMGIPPVGFREMFEREMAQRGIELNQTKGK